MLARPASGAGKIADLLVDGKPMELKTISNSKLAAACTSCVTHLAYAGKGQRQVVLALINTVFAQDTAAAAREQWNIVADQSRPKFPKLAAYLDDARDDVLAFMTFPKAHRAQLASTNPLERVNAEIKRRTDVVRIFPNDAAIVRLVWRIVTRAEHEWQLQRRYMQLEGLQG